MVSPSPTYSPWGWFLLFMGIHATPKRVRWICRRCGTLLRESTDPREYPDLR